MEQAAAAFLPAGTHILGTHEPKLTGIRLENPGIWRYIIIGVPVLAILKQLYSVDLNPSLIVLDYCVRHVGDEGQADQNITEESMHSAGV
jgi:hypothetical protein